MPESQSPGPLLAYFTAFFYILFSLIPDSHSMMVAWSWVFVWQVGLFCPLLWFLVQLWDNRRIYLLGNGFDLVLSFTLVSLFVSTLGAAFPQQARWQAWAALGFLAALYPISGWLKGTKDRYWLFLGQGYLSLAFVTFSLALWLSRTFLPEIERLQDLGVEDAWGEFDFSLLELRNWAPLGHQNYVAGYLILCLPTLLGLALLHRDWRRWLWATGVFIGAIDLYTTSSRGGWLGLAIASGVAFGFAWGFSQIRKFYLGLAGLLTVGVLAIFVLANDRLYNLVLPLLRGEFEELNYRWVNAQVGWAMGLEHWWTGAGLGNVPLLYQQYRPITAGRLSEFIYQLHSTPVQLWAEMGLWGLVLFFGVPIFLGAVLWRQRRVVKIMAREDRILLGSIYVGLSGYWALSWTDYQLDNVAISGMIVILLALLAAIARQDQPQNSIPQTPNPEKLLGKPRLVALGLLGLYGVMAIWLTPVHAAWEKSSTGFLALEQDIPDYDRFVDNLGAAQALVPWESYYAYQLGANLGELALQTTDLERRQQYLQEAIAWFNQGNLAAPHQEFGRSNLAWLHLANNDGAAAAVEFSEAARLVPAKRGVFYGLGLSLLAQEKTDLALEAIALEILRDPMFITSPIWRSGGLGELYPAVLERVMGHYETLLTTYPENALLHRCRGGIAWWIGDFERAEAEFRQYFDPTALGLLPGKEDLGQGTAIALLQRIWDQPEERLTLLDQAWAQVSPQQPLSASQRQEFLSSLANAPDFATWIRALAPEVQYRRFRAGFNVNSRHIDGPNPTDFWTVSENLAINTWFGEFFPTITYDPSFDRQLQPLREALIGAIAP
ncbi:O-antigen ligase family protein [Picosynechococcus sp. NKBG15041c]|uniref:O-antigen ligase family protein n=1 Tax=Picosynechococcus sp. NKBG15041c TaxID=1407650 RepID=UPI00040A207F|nr:O-antigen ligase family protein [Picosynechococcus sp. NKBG15041c]